MRRKIWIIRSNTYPLGPFDSVGEAQREKQDGDYLSYYPEEVEFDDERARRYFDYLRSKQ